MVNDNCYLFNGLFRFTFAKLQHPPGEFYGYSVLALVD